MPPQALPPTRRQAITALAGWPLLTAAQAPASGVSVEGQWFEATTRLADTELQLTGTGVRAVSWFKAFAAGLYLTQPARSTPQVIALAGPKRLRLRMLRDLPGSEFGKAVQKGVARNVSSTELLALQARLNAFGVLVAALGTVRLGSVVDLDHVPGQGMAMRLNGTLRGGAIAGDEFFVALLLSFLGEHPYDPKLKAGLLGLPA